MQGRSRLTLVAVLAFLAAASTARAAGRLVVLEPEVTPAPAVPLRDRFHDAAAKGAAPFDVVAPPELRVRLNTQNIIDCHGGACGTQMASAFSSLGFVSTTVVQTGKNYTIDVRVFDAKGGEVGARTGEKCEICTVREVAESIEKAVKAAVAASEQKLTAPPKPAPVPAVTTGDDDGPGPRESRTGKPPAAAKPPTTVASRTTPATKPPAPTTPTTTPRPRTEPEPRTDDKPRTALVTPAPSTTATTPATPSPLELPRRDTERGPFPWRPVAYGLFSVAAASLAATIAFSAFALRENEPTCDKPDPRTSCPEIYSGNTTPAVVFGVLTGVAAGLGATSLYLDYRERRRAAPTLTLLPTRDGILATARFEF